MTAPGWTFHLLLAVGLAGMPAAAQGARRFGALEFSPCALSSPGLPLTVPAQCTSVTVPEDHSRPDGRRIELALAWVPSTARKPEPDPVFMLAGGPGQSARDSYAAVSPASMNTGSDSGLRAVLGTHASASSMRRPSDRA